MNAKATNNVSTYTKILLLVIVASILFFTLFFSIYYYTIKQERLVYQSTEKQFQNESSAISKLNSESQIAVLKDITYWDELVDFFKTRDNVWFKNSIASLLQLYKVDYIGVYDLEGSFVSSANSSKIQTSNFIDSNFFKLLHSKRVIKFHQRIPEGVVEVFAATVHSSDDPYKIKTEPSGYFIMARLLDKDYIENLQKTSNAQIEVVSTKYEAKVGVHSIQVISNLYSWNQLPVAKLVFKRPFDVSFNETKKALEILIVALLVLLSLVLFYLRKWIFMPLTLITRILETGNKRALKLLKNTQGEFKHIGELFESSVIQQSQLIEAKEKAEESDKLKSAFLTNLSHEIRTPMNAIIGFADLLETPEITDAERGEYVKIVKNSGSSLVSIIDDLIEMSKIDSNLVLPNNTPINLEAFIDQLYEAIKVTIPNDKKILFNLVKNPKGLNKKIITDPIKLRQILTNLLTNAIKFTDSGYVKLTYSWKPRQSKIEFVIEDTGIGIKKENQKLIFDRFRRVDGDYSIKVGGLGLGLAISKAYIEMLKGKIKLKSEIGKGSVFSFKIPVECEKEITNEIENTDDDIVDELIVNDCTILVAEDDNINFLLFEKLIKDKNYKIIRAKDGVEAVEFCRNEKNIDLILMDIKMPRMSGFDAFVKIRNFNKTTPIIAQTAFSSTDEIEKIKSLGFDNYITKPINKKILFSVLNQFLKKTDD